MLVDIKGLSSLQKVFAQFPTKLIVLDFTAKWCGPCQRMHPIFESLSTKFSNAVFCRVDEADNGPVISTFGVEAFPTFQLYVNSNKVEEVRGADSASLEAAILRHLPKEAAVPKPQDVADPVEAANAVAAEGNDFFRQRMFDQAIEKYSTAIGYDPTQTRFFSNRSAAYLSSGLAQRALDDAEECIKLNPSWAKGYNRKGAALQHLGQKEKAVAVYETGLKAAPGDAGLVDALSQLEAELASAPPPPGMPGMPGMPGGSPFSQPNALEKLRANPRTAIHMADPKFVQSIQLLGQQGNQQAAMGLLQQDPRLLEAYLVLLGMDLDKMQHEAEKHGEKEKEEEKRREAEREKKRQAEEEARLKAEEAERIAKETPEERQERLTKEKAVELKNGGNSLYKQKKFSEALELYEQAEKLNPKEMTFPLNKAAAYLELEEFESAMEEAKKAVDIGRMQGASLNAIHKAYVRMGTICEKQGDYKNAIACLEDAQLEHGDPKIASRIRRLKQMQKKKEEEEYLDPALAAEAKARGNELFGKGDFIKAIDEYSEAIKRDPTNAVYWCNRAAARTKKMDCIKAAEDCRQAIKLDPAYVKAYTRLGALEFLMKEYHKALETYKKGLSLDESNEECLQGLQRTMMKINMSATDTTVDEAQAQRAMADPKVQSILTDPVVNQVLKDAQSDPQALQKALADPGMASKLETLIACGLLKIGGRAPAGMQR